MLANERLIYKMSIGQKLKLLTSLKLHESSPDEGYEFPVFRMVHNPLQDCEGIFATQFPSDRALASSWNKLLVSEVYDKIGQETGALKKYAYYNVTDDILTEDVSEDYYLTGKMLANKIKGLRTAKQFVNFEEVPAAGDEELSRLLKDLILTEAKPDSVLVKGAENASTYKTQYNCGNLFYGVASNCQEVATLFLNGCTMVFLTDDIVEQLIDYFTKLTIAYRAAYADYRAEVIGMTELDAMCRRLEIFDEKILDEACDKLISTLLEMRDRGAAACPNPDGINSNHAPLFDEPAHDALALTVARQSIVLMKNDGILPLSNTVKVAVLGEAGKDYSYQTEYFNGRATAERVPFNSVNLYEINGVGFGSGYAKGMPGRTDLTDAALNLCSEADCAIVYLSADKGQRVLPAEQSELLDKLFEKGVKTIAVVSSDGAMDMTFAEKCSAVLFTFRCGQGASRAVFDIIKGEATPSGRLTETIPVSFEGRTRPCDYRTMPREEVRYPFGFGLSYTSFEYSNLKISEKGISCTVKNVGGYDGFCVVQFYLQKVGSYTALKDKLLRGFCKVYVKKNDYARIEIPFDETTFKVYDEESGLYRIEGGEYSIFVSENYFNDKLTGSVTLADYVYKETDFKNELVESASGEDVKKIKFDEKQEPPEARKAKKQLSFGLKLAIAIILAVYYNGIMAALAFTDVVSEKGLIFYIVIGVLAAVFDGLFIAYVSVISVRRKRQHYVQVNDVLTDMVEKVADFDEIAKVTYKTPVEEEEPDEQEDTQLEAETVEVQKTYDLSFDESGDDAPAAQQVTFEELCTNFREYAQSKGVTVDVASARSLFAAIGASKIIILTTKNTEVLPDFVNVLNGYFGNSSYTVADGAWHSASDLLWKGVDDKFVVSEFANEVYSATKTKDKCCGAIICGVDAATISEWFKPFLDYANHPTEEHILKLNDDLSFRLPDNITYVLVPDNGSEKNVSRELADASLQVELVLNRFEGETEEVEVKTISKNSLLDIVKEAKEVSFLPEKVWKRLDELIEAIRASEKFSLGNKNTLQLERFTSVILECGGDENECLTALFLSKLVPVLKLTRTYRGEGGDKTVFGLIEKLFPEEDLTKIQRALTKTA